MKDKKNTLHVSRRLSSVDINRLLEGYAKYGKDFYIRSMDEKDIVESDVLLRRQSYDTKEVATHIATDFWQPRIMDKVPLEVNKDKDSQVDEYEDKRSVYVDVISDIVNEHINLDTIYERKYIIRMLILHSVEYKFNNLLPASFKKEYKDEIIFTRDEIRKVLLDNTNYFSSLSRNKSKISQRLMDQNGAQVVKITSLSLSILRKYIKI